MDVMKSEVIDFVLTDFEMGGSGLEVLQQVKTLYPETDVAVMTAFGKLEEAVEMMKLGAYYFLTKPIDLDLLESLISRVKEKHQLIAENRQLKDVSTI